ncbi:hypothetical protein PR048_026483 [Dryococelus australis]|uniref:Uncharacterized protein n=1 Tax=Dryococelus australis TaxID=614101 RepID=A0ABQ9GLF8_9NEOP|nr:hypothetical protein PR048_026483 [Dryococelus australis]
MFAQANVKHANAYTLLSIVMEHMWSSEVSAVSLLFDSHQCIGTICGHCQIMDVSIVLQSIAIQLNNQLNKDMENAPSALMAVFTTYRFLCRQGLSVRDHEDGSSNFIQLLELRKA